jgi:ASC-1-like (ASCH) protein
MATIHKKIWPKWFNLIKKGKKNVEFRLADFRLKERDTLLLEEWDAKKKKYTGRILKTKVKKLIKKNPFDFYSAKDIKKHGIYIIGFEIL